MKIRLSALILLALTFLQVQSQLLNFSLRTNNEQLLEKALKGSVVIVEQSYELCDTVTSGHFGRNGKQYFNRIPYMAILSDRGVIIPSEALHPWESDQDFAPYRTKYKPVLSSSSLKFIFSANQETGGSPVRILAGCEPEIIGTLALYPDSVAALQGLKTDIKGGKKQGWLVWFSSAGEDSRQDSIRLTSIKRDLEIPSDGQSMKIEAPETVVNPRGGMYVVAEVTAPGQLTLFASGILSSQDGEWRLEFPFLEVMANEVSSELTPIGEEIEPKRKTPAGRQKFHGQQSQQILSENEK